MTNDKILRTLSAFKRHCGRSECAACRYKDSAPCYEAYLRDVEDGFDLRKAFGKEIGSNGMKGGVR